MGEMNIEAVKTTGSKESRPKVVTVDLDGCLVMNKFPEVGGPISKTIPKFKQEQANDAKVILWISRRDKPLDDVMSFCKKQSIHLDAVNKNLPGIIKTLGGGTRKIFASEYWDDQAVYVAKEEDSWAAWEVALACQSKREASKDTDDRAYGVLCCESVLRAYQALVRDGHSGLSIRITKSILSRLVDSKCLAPIEDTLNTRSNTTGKCSRREGYQKHQCKHISSLFKEAAPGGTTTYSGISRVCGINVNCPNTAFSNEMMTRLIDTIFLITMPCLPSTKKYRVFSEDFLVDPRNDDYNTFAYLYILTPDGKRVELSRYFREEDGEMVPIEKAGYEERKVKRVEKE